MLIVHSLTTEPHYKIQTITLVYFASLLLETNRCWFKNFCHSVSFYCLDRTVQWACVCSDSGSTHSIKTKTFSGELWTDYQDTEDVASWSHGAHMFRWTVEACIRHPSCPSNCNKTNKNYKMSTKPGTSGDGWQQLASGLYFLGVSDSTRTFSFSGNDGGSEQVGNLLRGVHFKSLLQ